MEPCIYKDQINKILDSIPRLEEKINNINTSVSAHTVVISKFLEFQANHDGEIKGKKEEIEREKIATELKSTQRRDKIQKRFLLTMAVIAAIGLSLTAYFGFRGNKKQDSIMVNQEVIKEKQDNLGVPVIVNKRGEIMTVPDSTKILYFNNDSMRYLIKRIGK